MPRAPAAAKSEAASPHKSAGQRTPEKKSRADRTVESKAETVKVVVRCRPLNKKEIAGGFEKTVEIDSKRGHILLRNPKAEQDPPREFTFDAVYDENSKQVDLYDETFRPLVQSVLEGFNGTIFAYGQTGTGKTYTMEGVREDPELRGVIPSSFEHIFDHIGRSENRQYLVRASYLEIYQEEVRDLLSKDQSRRLELKERPDTGTYVRDLSSFVCKSVNEIEHVMAVGNKNRSTGATNMNEHSSRSHAIFVVTVECSELGADGEAHIRVGKLNMVDLAGSERQAKTGATGERLKEATKINLSLSALGNVISALVDGKSTHVPYRDSKLTRLLQDSLGGNARTIMVANMGPAAYNYDESLSTLRYANRAKNIKNKPKINEDPKDALLREFQEEIGKLKAQLEARSGAGSRAGGGSRSKRSRSARAGEPPSDQESEQDGLTVEEYMQKERSRLEAERSAIVGDTTIIAEEKERLLEEVHQKEEQLERERTAKQQLAQRIKEMESKLLSGGKNIADRTNKQQRQLDLSRQQIAEQKAREREMLQRIEEQEGTRLDLQQTFQSLQQEVDVKTKKLKKLFAKLQAVKRDIADATEEFNVERRELEEAHIALRKELKLKQLIIENFIAPDELASLLSRAQYREEDDEGWLLTRRQQSALGQRPVSARGARRPVSEYARTAGTVVGGTRFKGENIMTLEMDAPSRTTRDYQGPVVAARVQAALQAALTTTEDVISIDAGGAPPAGAQFLLRASRKEAAAATSKRSRPPPGQSPSSARQYPQSRGLVPK